MTMGASSERSSVCSVCAGQRHSLATFCRRCKDFLDRGDMRRRPDKQARAEALRRGWDGSGFRCYYTGVRLNETDFSHPCYLTFDHRTPRVENDIVLAAACINDMKSDLTEEEFRAVVMQLAARFSGRLQPFDEEVLTLAHWKRR
jgi:hypothetical protein